MTSVGTSTDDLQCFIAEIHQKSPILGHFEPKMAIFGPKWSFWAKMAIFAQKWLIWEILDEFPRKNPPLTQNHPKIT